MREAFKFNIIKCSSWTSSTETLCVRTTEITLKGFITQIANRAHNRSNVVLRSKHHCLFRREFLEGRLQLSPSWRVLRGAAGHILQEFHKLDNVQSGAEGWVCHDVWIFLGEKLRRHSQWEFLTQLPACLPPCFPSHSDANLGCFDLSQDEQEFWEERWGLEFVSRSSRLNKYLRSTLEWVSDFEQAA